MTNKMTQTKEREYVIRAGTKKRAQLDLSLSIRK